MVRGARVIHTVKSSQWQRVLGKARLETMELHKLQCATSFMVNLPDTLTTWVQELSACFHIHLLKGTINCLLACAYQSSRATQSSATRLSWFNRRAKTRRLIAVQDANRQMTSAAMKLGARVSTAEALEVCLRDEEKSIRTREKIKGICFQCIGMTEKQQLF